MRILREPSTVEIMIDQKQLEKVESFKYLDSVIRNDARCTREIKCRITLAKAALNKHKTHLTSKLGLNL